MRIAIVGTGYAADLYLQTLPNHPQLELLGVTDRSLERAERVGRFYAAHVYPSYSELLADDRVELMVNLTSVRSHHEVTRAALLAGKHVYSEKPLAITLPEAEELVALAESRSLRLAGAPCSVLGETAQTLWKALRDQAAGRVRLVYAELDDGPIHLMRPETWRSDSGTPWPAHDEFELGCTMEHAAYYVTWLLAFFGPVRRVTSFASVLIADKGVAVADPAPDFSVACLEFDSGVVARMTHGIYAPYDHRLRVIGDDGVLATDECWDYAAPVYLQRRTWGGLKAEKHPLVGRLLRLGRRKLSPLPGPAAPHRPRRGHSMDFPRGIAEVADAIAARRPARLTPELALHVTEITLAMQQAGAPRELRTTCPQMEPMPWAV